MHLSQRDCRSSKGKYNWKVGRKSGGREGVSIKKDPDNVHGQNDVRNLGKYFQWL